MPRNNDDKRKDKKVEIPKYVKVFTSMTFKKYKHKYGYGASKKEIKKYWIDFLIDLLPGVVDWTVSYGHIQNDEIKTAKNDIYRVLNTNDELIARLIKILKKEDLKGLKLFPIILKEMIVTIENENKKILEENPKAATYDSSDFVKLVGLIMNKQLKKAAKNDIDKNLAFDILCIIPSMKAIDISRFYRISSFYRCLYEHAKTKEFTVDDINNIMSVFVKDEYTDLFLLFELLERNSAFAKLNDSQKKLYIAISQWCFETLNAKTANDMKDVLSAYVNSRRTDARKNKDSDRRYPLTKLTEDEYPKIFKVVTQIVSDYPEAEKYLG